MTAFLNYQKMIFLFIRVEVPPHFLREIKKIKQRRNSNKESKEKPKEDSN